MKNKIKQNYHWIIAVVLFLELGVFAGIINNESLFVIPVTEGLHTSRSSYALASSLRNLTTFFVTFISGAFVTKLGNRKMMLAGLLLGVFSYALAACSQNIAYITVSSALVGIASGLGTTTTATRIVSDWFQHRQGIVLGVVSSATGLGGSLVCFLLNGAMSEYGFRGGYAASALMVLLSGILVLLFVYSRPSDKGLNPYGFGVIEKSRKKAVKNTHWHGYSMQALIRRPIFYIMLLATFLSSICIYLMFSVVVPHLQDCGLSAGEATSIQSAMLLMMAVSKIFCGALSDKLGAERITLLCVSFVAISLWMMAGISNVASAWIAIVLYGISLSLVTVIAPLLTGALFGYQAYSRVVGIVMAMPSLSNMLAAPISNTAYDYLGSYSPVFRVGAVLSVVAIGLYLLLFAMAKKDRQKYEAQTVQ